MVLIIRIIVNTTFKNTFDKSLGLRFKSRAGQIGQNVANRSPPLRHFFERICVAWAQRRGVGPANSFHALAYYSEYNKRFDFDLLLLLKNSKKIEILKLLKILPDSMEFEILSGPAPK